MSAAPELSSTDVPESPLSHNQIVTILIGLMLGMFLIPSTIVTPLYGKLSDIYGRKPFFITAITVFVIGSGMCTFADSMIQLAAFRAVQGVGAGGLFSLALAIIGDIVPPMERAKYQGYFLAVFGTSSVLGPVIGGFCWAGRARCWGR